MNSALRKQCPQRRSNYGLQGLLTNSLLTLSLNNIFSHLYSPLRVLSCGNPFSVIAMVVEERMRIAMELAKDLTNDMQSGDLDLDTPGIKEFYRQMKTLVESLGRFVHEE
jgi:hypothetical protein